jgi:RHS repeat-associated protein
MTDQSGAITYARTYDPYGVVTQAGGTSQSAYGYTGEQQDTSGMVYLRARYYNPTDGRFQSRDTWGGDDNSPMSFNRWNYVEGNPVNLSDPSGHAPTSCIRGYSDMSTAEEYVPKDGSALTTYVAVAAGIAIQCWGLNARDPRDPNNSGVGPAQVSDNQASTPYGKSVPDDRGYGLRCYVIKASLPRDERDDLLSCVCFTPEDIKNNKDFNQKYELGPILDPSDPNNAAALMRRRIEQVINNCINCSETDKFIAAALGQNGPGLTPGDALTLSSWGKNNPFRPAKDDNIAWGSYFDDRINKNGYKGWFDTSYQLQLFFDFAKRLHHDGYYLPDIAGYLVRDLKNRKAP